MPLVLLTSPPFTFMLIFPSTAEEQTDQAPGDSAVQNGEIDISRNFPVYCYYCS